LELRKTDKMLFISRTERTFWRNLELGVCFALSYLKEANILVHLVITL